MTESSDTPLNEFSGCHEGIIRNFKRLNEFLELYQQDASDSQLSKMAKQLLDFFDDVVKVHHSEEEEELFSAVNHCLEKTEESAKASEAIERLVQEHRQLESIWSQIESDLRLIAKKKKSDLNVDLAGSLAQKYLAHAQFEEDVFLPMAAHILSGNEMSALGLSLHMRHMSNTVIDYV